jgi:hypothetical protein
LRVQLPQGPDYDLNRIYIFVNVIDDQSGTTVFDIPMPVTVLPDNQLATNLANSISTNDPACPALVALTSGNLNLVTKNVIGLTSVFNIQSNGAMASSSNTNTNVTSQINTVNNQFAELREFMVNIVSNLSVTDLSSIKVISSALSAATQTPSQITANAAVNYNKFFFESFLFFF